MLYQNPLVGTDPYIVRCGRNLNAFPDHTHYELEIVYCLEGIVDVIVDGVSYSFGEGEAIVIDSMANHSYPERDGGDNRILFIEMGPVFLREKFKYITEVSFSAKIYRKDNSPSPILDCLSDIKCEVENGDEMSDILIRADLYRLFVSLVRDVLGEKTDFTPRNNNFLLDKIENALDLVHRRYKEPLTVNEAAAVCGYGKSNFCKVFKNTLGVSFHNYLNSYRIENAKCLLTETAISVENIADVVGFGDSKMFCRAFKNSMGLSPGQYRKKFKIRT